MTTIFVSALLLGLMGSFHCVGMCGPIAIALPLQGNSFSQKLFGGFLYNIGRSITYAIMGAIFGLLGQGLQLLGFQQKISVLMGAVMIISVFFPALFRTQYAPGKSWSKGVGVLKKKIAGLFSIRSYQSLFFIGMLNGLLPCGLVYMAIAGAIGVGSSAGGALYMLLFGLATVPMLLAISMAGNMLSFQVRQKINKLIPVMVVVVGLLFILRGLSLGIPYLSPPREKIEQKFEQSLQSETKALHKESKSDCCSSH